MKADKNLLGVKIRDGYEIITEDKECSAKTQRDIPAARGDLSVGVGKHAKYVLLIYYFPFNICGVLLVNLEGGNVSSKVNPTFPVYTSKEDRKKKEGIAIIYQRV